jgi:hypothetical protein
MTPDLDPRPFGCCGTEGEICCGGGCPCPDERGKPIPGTQIQYVQVGEWDFTEVNGLKSVWVSLIYEEIKGAWTCTPRVVIQDVERDEPRIEEIRRER